jgi:hypothetical protein
MEPYRIRTFANIRGQLGDTQWIPIGGYLVTYDVM